MDLNRLDMVDDASPHSLLEPPSPAYSNVTVRRAFIVWMYCGQANKFKDVCNYYHYLEALEEKLPIEQRASSRHHEFNMFSNPPLAGPHLRTLFPRLYSDSPIEPYYIKKLESIKNEKCIFKLEGFNEMRQKGVTTAEIIETSQIIRKYCKTQLIPLRKFLEEYKQYANKCCLTDTVNNVASYIKRKMVQAELDIIANYPQDFSFLNSTSEHDNSNSEDMEIINADKTTNLKVLLRMNNSDSKINGKVERKNSCDEFFQSFNKTQKISSYSPLTPKIEDFVKYFDQNKQKSRSVESVFHGKTNILNTLGFNNQNSNDSNVAKVSEFNKLRKIT